MTKYHGRVCVFNVSFGTYDDPEPLEKLFQQFGEARLELLIDEKTLRRRGWGFVYMLEKDAERAEKALDGYDFDGCDLVVAIDRDDTHA